MNRPWQNKEKLEKEYRDIGSTYSLAEKWDCTPSCICKWLKKFDIPRRQGNPENDIYNEDRLRELYEEEQSVAGVTERLQNTKSTVTVIKWMKNFGIETNDIRPSARKRKNVECDYCGSESHVPQNEAKQENWFCDWECYNEWRKGRTGELHRAWKENSVEVNYGDGWKRISEKVRSEDGSCSLCDSTSNLEVHHIKKVREFDDAKEAHKRNNLVTLCRDCHTDVDNNLSLQEQRELFK